MGQTAMDSQNKHQSVNNVGSTCLEESSASQERKLEEESLKEDDLELLCQLEKTSMKSKDKINKHKKKEAKKLKKSKTVEQETKTFSTPCERRESASPLHDSSNTSGSYKKKKRNRKRSLEFVENCSSQRPGEANNMPEICDLPDSPINRKKTKKKKQRVHFETRDENHSHISDILSGGNTHQNSDFDVTTDPKLKGMVTRDTVTFHREKEPLMILQSNIARVQNHSTPLSSPTGLARTILEDKVGVQVKAEDMNNVSDHSQDLFITQKLFLPAPVSSCSSGDSPPLGQEQAGPHHRSDSTLLPSQFSGLPHKSADLSDVTRDHSASSAEKSTQTDDVFSYLALMTFLKKVRALETCSEEPLDLSLPSRIRAASDLLNVSNDDVILIESTSPPAVQKAAGRGTGKSWGSPPRFGESRLVQSVLNSSYFFKGKGDHSDEAKITPLLKLKLKSKKRARKSVLKQPKREYYHV
ncbi:uncharacterized protein LOC142103450 [Mixophyes fleayi]|uniref:uncharacterized protein LOC142103450 n=1 Tax=Mixophyes fleayi TaxID=3061075 RepID=UPI003F4E20BB